MKVDVFNRGITALLLTAALVLAACPTGEPNTPADTVVNLYTIPGITAPVTGETPVVTVASAQHSGSVTWSPPVTGTFAAGTPYTATISLIAASGYTFDGIPTKVPPTMPPHWAWLERPLVPTQPG
jgi:hypothetical protein